MYYSRLEEKSVFSSLRDFISWLYFTGTAYPIMIGNTLTLFREATDSVDENIATIIVGIAIVVSVNT